MEVEDSSESAVVISQLVPQHFQGSPMIFRKTDELFGGRLDLNVFEMESQRITMEN